MDQSLQEHIRRGLIGEQDGIALWLCTQCQDTLTFEKETRYWRHMDRKGRPAWSKKNKAKPGTKGKKGQLETSLLATKEATN